MGRKAGVNNARDGITGALLVYGDRIMQLLEGEPHQVRACFARIQADPRHTDLCLLEQVPIEARVFGPWAMRHVHVDLARDPAVAGFLARLGQRPDAVPAVDPSEVSLAKSLLHRLSEPPPDGAGA